MSSNEREVRNLGRRLVVPCGCAVVILALALFVCIMGTPDGGGLGGQQGRRATCLSNLKQTGLAFMMYTGDYDGTLPSSAIVNRSKVWNKADFLRFATRQGTLPPPNHIAKGKATWAMLLYPYVKSHEASMTCPYDPDQYNERDAPASYYYKTALDKAWYGSGCTKRFRTDGDFDYPGDTVLFYERLPFHYQDLLDALHIRDSKLREGLLDGSRINVVYLDGHATMVRVRNATSGNPPDCATASDGEPMYFNYDNSTGKTVSGAAGYVDPGRYSDKLERLGD